ncbi:vascular cell adhesion protein 1-like isoform X2 [Hemitrygon akajei]|uniref:vascular cell adhesion protein 1-like isoform X2 n=1 Tax=Hemitrygon akajei TaxID=2704970 RepID=UPI003BF9E330
MYFRSIYLFALLFVVTGKLNGYEVSVKTNPPAVEFGHSLEVTCSTTCNNPTIIMEYKPGTDPNSTLGDKWITDRFPSVQQWDFSAPCTVICQSAGKQVKEVKQVVPVYNRNLSVVPLPEVLEVYKPYQLECIGPKVYPKDKLVLTWLRGSEVVQNISTEDPGLPDDGPLKNVLNFTPSISDDGMVYTCLADLNLDSNSTKQIANASVTLQTYSFPEPPKISNINQVELNQQVQLKCEIPNVYPAEKMRLMWTKDGTKWKSDTNVSDHSTVWATIPWTPHETGLTQFNCTADFEDYPSVPSKMDSVVIEAYVFSNPEIHIPTTIEGIPVNITCSVFNVSGELQLRLKKGSEILVNRSASTGLTIYHTVNPRAELNGQEFTCEAELTFHHHSNTTVKQQSAALAVWSFPDPPRILSRDPVEVNQNVTLTCEVPNVYPAEKMRVRLFWGGEQQISVTIQPDATTVRATTTWTPRETNLTEVSCMADFGDYPSIPPKIDSIFIEVYVFSNPEIHIPITIEGIPVNMTCSVFNVSGELQLRLKKGSEILVSRSASTGLTIYHTVNPGAELNGQQFTCEAELTLHHHSNTIVKRQSTALTVWSFPDPPRILSRDPVEVNQNVTLTCEVPNVYPAEKMRVRLFWGGEQQISVTIQPDATTVRATTTWTPRGTNLTEVSCMADFGDYPSIPPKIDSIFIEVYVFSNPEIHIPITTEGIPVNITCSMPNVSGKLQLRLKKGSEILVNRSASTGLTIYHTVNPRAELNGQQFTCEAELTFHHHSNIITKERSNILTVHGKGLEIWKICLIVIIITLAIIGLVVGIIWYVMCRPSKRGKYKVSSSIANKDNGSCCKNEHQNSIPLLQRP